MSKKQVDIIDTIYDALEDAKKSKTKRIEKNVRMDKFIRLMAKAMTGDKESSPKIEFQDTDGNTVVFVAPKGNNSAHIVRNLKEMV